MSLERTSRYMSLILRHKPEVIGIQLDEHGWANVEELIASIAKTQEFNRDILELIVRTDEKQRYSFNEDGTLIRANQGHSIPVDVELKEMQPPETLWHGTGEKYVASIDQQGLNPRTRLYVHLSGTDEKGNAGITKYINSIKHLLRNDIRDVRITKRYHVRNSSQRQDKCNRNSCHQENYKNNNWQSSQHLRLLPLSWYHLCRQYLKESPANSLIQIRT